MTEKTTMTLLCERCRMAVNERTEPDGHKMAVCQSCGVTDTLNNAVHEAATCFADKSARDATTPFEQIRQSPFFKVTVSHPPERNYRFILERAQSG